MKDMQIPIAKPYFGQEEEDSIHKVLKTGWIVQGPKVEEFETVFSRYVGSEFAIATSSCTAALHLSLLAAGIKKDDEVLCPSFTFIATANAIEHAGARPRFCDIDPSTFNISPESIEELITPNTKAIVPVDQFGLPAEHDKIQNIARQHNIKVIEDAACALGASYHGKKIGSVSEISCFSFHPRKIITTGEGGMITTNDPEVAGMARSLRSHGLTSTLRKTDHTSSPTQELYQMIGYNYRMTDLQAAIGCAQMGKLHQIIKTRRERAKRYSDLLSGIGHVLTKDVPPQMEHTFQTFIATIDARFAKNVVEHLNSKGIASKFAIPVPCHKQPCYQDKYGQVRLPDTEKAQSEAVILPLYHQMTDKEQDHIIQAIKEAIRL